MAAEREDHPARDTTPAHPWWITRWAVWELPGRLLTPVLTVECAAIVLLIVSFAGDPAADSVGIRNILILCLLGLLHTEISRDVERVRWRVTGALHVDLNSVWTFAAAILLAPTHAVLVAVVVHTHLWLRSARTRAPLYRQVFSTATIVLACFAASGAMAYVLDERNATPRSGWELVAIALGLLVFLTVNTALVAGAIAVSTPRADPAQLLGEWDENMLEIATLSLGGLVAVALSINPWLVLLVFPPLLVLHRAVLVRHLEQAASTDSKTGLLNAAAWHAQAERELRRSHRHDNPRGVLVLDLDHFKAVNDNHGHLAGDHVLVAVADAMRDEVRERDLVGRFGGEEFVVMLAGLEDRDPSGLEAVAERIRRRVASLRVEIPTPDGPLTVAGLSVSVGGAVCPGTGGDLRNLLQIADAALYSAKRGGRNMVRMGLVVPVQEPGTLPRAAGDPPAEAR